MRRFKATAIAAAELTELGAFVVVLAEHPDGSGRRLEIQRALSLDEPDDEDTYCLCTELGAAHDGGVTSWTLGDRELTLHLDEEAAEALEGPALIIELTLSENERAQLLAGLERVFADAAKVDAGR